MTATDPQGEGDVEAQAAMWFARMRSLPVSRETLEGFVAWSRDPEHASALEAVERFWVQAGNVAAEPGIVDITREALGRKPRRASGRWRPRKRSFPTVAIALASAVLIVGGTAGYFALRPSGEVYATRIGEQSLVRLTDGSQVRLDTGTRMVVAFGHGERRVRLEGGQASFAVAHDPKHPFQVDVDGAQVTAIGTKFDVRRVGEDISVTLVEGRVRVVPKQGPVNLLVAGQQWTERANQQAAVRSVNIDAMTAWEHGRIVLDGWTLSEAIAEVNRYSRRSIQLSAPRYAGSRLSGSFLAGDVTSFVAAMTAILPLEATAGPNGSIVLTERDNSPKKILPSA